MGRFFIDVITAHDIISHNIVLLVSGQPEVEMDPEVFRRCSRVFAQMLSKYQFGLDEGLADSDAVEFARAASQKSFVAQQFTFGMYDMLQHLANQDDLILALNELCVQLRMSSFKSIHNLKSSAEQNVGFLYVEPSGQEAFSEDVYVGRFVECMQGFVRYNAVHYKADPVLGMPNLYDPKDEIADQISQEFLGMLDGFPQVFSEIEAGVDWTLG